jgi:hypothetical protein
VHLLIFVMQRVEELVDGASEFGQFRVAAAGGDSLAERGVGGDIGDLIVKFYHLASIAPPGGPQIQAAQSEYCGQARERRQGPEIDYE